MTAADEISRGDRRALARGLTVIENSGDGAAELLDALCSKTGAAHRTGITGPPGAGKSTLVAGLTREFRAAGQTVGIVAVDPTSPFTGGALLGDRHRMSDEARDEGVFIRSLASRGASGGLARAAPDALDLLDAAGFDRLIVETVGVGQTEMEVAGTADTVVVVLSPESGDAVQAMKAGLLEIADILCVNKSDREGAESLVAALESMLHHRAPSAAKDDWSPKVVSTNALENAVALQKAIASHETWLGQDDHLAARRTKGTKARLTSLVGAFALERLLDRAGDLFDREAAEVIAGRCSVRHAATRALTDLLGEKQR
ncbi:MAG: methylmalonyl Co-A mutase-associated GTPase MeaB [Planctomycetota bacterium]